MTTNEIAPTILLDRPLGTPVKELDLISTITRITYDQFEEMIRRGDFEETDDRYELIHGEIELMPRPGPPHEFVVDELNEWSFAVLPAGAVRVRVQQSLGIPALDSLTLPDLAWMSRRDYSKTRPLVEDVLLLIEVSDSTLSRDRDKKGKLYASAGIRDYWIINIKGRCLEVRRDPVGDAYTSVQSLRPGQEARPLAFPDLPLPVSRLFPDAEPA
ncbi:MAG: Uma2 family endonuclease [Isosphaeraceae bacterium]